MKRAALVIPLLAACEAEPAPVTRDAGVRCVAAGIADPGVITWEIEPHTNGFCTHVPAVLVDGAAPALFEAGDAVGTLRCTGLAPGAPARLQVDLEIRLAPPMRHTPVNCNCGTWNVFVDTRVNGLPGPPPFNSTSVAGNRSCLDGPSQRAVLDVVADARGELRVDIDLTRCDTGLLEQARCLFVRGTRIALVEPGDRDR